MKRNVSIAVWFVPFIVLVVISIIFDFLAKMFRDIYDYLDKVTIKIAKFVNKK